ncbi:MAG: nucleotidyltransferase [Bacteroidetes bacterium]|jgi:dTDP-glucose pyrophosphorylase|nr:nucleotidyltransferase [Bacteroidota bacterium]MBT6686644.1 nucleotidyltransferase [Bacteroidota bacterium]MBT7144846.1 nucleotidyltransferase [Bacteroidota bacterium]MBT7490234.1 nucleotidyltransferase [Bacteroidota bacterium]
MKPSLLILAAGMGSRYGSLKQIDQIGPSGETIIDYSIYDAISYGFGKLVFVIRKNIEKEFREVFLRKYEGKIEINYVFQEIENLPENFRVPENRKKPWGTAHAVLVAKKKINEPFLVINGDDFYGRDAYRVCSEFLQNIENDMDYCMPGYFVKNTLSENGGVSRGICELKNEYLQAIVERKNIVQDKGKIFFINENNQKQFLSGLEYCSMNMFGFSPSIFQFLEEEFRKFLHENQDNLGSEFFLPLAINNLLEKEKISLKVLPNSARWFGVTYKEDKQASKDKIYSLVRNGKYPENLWL